MRRIICFIIAGMFVGIVQAGLKLPAVFGDNMVLQQQDRINLWGQCERNEQVTITVSWDSNPYSVRADAEGKWSVKISTPEAGYTVHQVLIVAGEEEVRINNVQIGEVWLCSGQSNMEMPMKGYKNQPVAEGLDAIVRSKNKNIRFITVKRNASVSPEEDIVGNWQEAVPETVRDFSATAYFYGKLLNEILDVPVGLILSAWGGSPIESWMSKEMLSAFPTDPIPVNNDSIKVPNRTPTVLYNGMIRPIAGYTIKGCIWYQGESNYEKPDRYPLLFSTMVKGWRSLWNQGDFPFYYCQIAPYDYKLISPPEKQGGKFNSAFLREAQYRSLALIPRSGMAVLSDAGDEFCIHPADKSIPGERLALLALEKTYDIKGIVSESPVFKEMQITGNKAVLSFDNAPMWLTSFGKKLGLFEVAGKDRVFYPAEAVINRSKVEVFSEKVPQPVAVRYGFKDFIAGDLFGTEGLPVSSFRTDDWDE